MIRQHNQRVIKSVRPNNFCYHCNETFETKEDLKYHVENIVKKQLNPSYSPETDYPMSQQNAAGHTLRSDFFQLDPREAEEIQSHLASDVYANFTLDGKECYHCGVEFQSTEEMKNHPSRCDRMKNARNIGQVNLSDFNGEVHITQKDTFSKSRQKRKKNPPKTARPKKSKVTKKHRVVERVVEAPPQEPHHPDEHVEYQQYDEYEHYDENYEHQSQENYDHHGYDDSQLHDSHAYQEVQPHKGEEQDDPYEPKHEDVAPEPEEHIQLQPVNYKQRRTLQQQDKLRPTSSNSQQNNSNSGFHCFHCDHIFNSRQELQQHVNEIAKKNQFVKAKKNHKDKIQADDYRVSQLYKDSELYN